MNLDDIGTICTALKYIGGEMAISKLGRMESTSGTELMYEEVFIPLFSSVIHTKNMLERNIGFICKSPMGRIVKLLQIYDSYIYKQEPEMLPAQWGILWSKDPRHALEFIASSTSPYSIGDCCKQGEKVYRSTIENNVFSPKSYPGGWDFVE